MCDFCNNSDEFKTLFQQKAEFFSGKITLDVNLARSWIGISMYSEAESFIDKEIKINYCPICGRKF